MSGIRIHASSVFIGIHALLRHASGFDASRLVPRTLASNPTDATGNRSLLQTVGTSFGDSNVFLLVAFFPGSPLTLLALRLARLRWPLGGCAGRGSGHPALRPDCHPGTTACHPAIVHARRVCDALPCSKVRGRCAWSASSRRVAGHPAPPGLRPPVARGSGWAALVFRRLASASWSFGRRFQLTTEHSVFLG